MKQTKDRLQSIDALRGFGVFNYELWLRSGLLAIVVLFISKEYFY